MNDVEKTKKPAIRFDGFCSEWTKYEIRDFIEDYTEKTTVQNQYPVLTSSQQQGIVFQEEYFADRQVTTSENVGYFILPFGFFTYRSRSDNSVFVFNRNNIIDRGIISYYYPVFRPNNIDSNFLLRRLNVGTAKQIVKIVEGTGQKVLNHDKFKKLSISVPDEKECAKIGSFFETIDQQITLAQRKYDKLLTFKKSMLEKLFPQNGAKVPEVRFAGFAGEWVEYRFGDIVTKYSDPVVTPTNGYTRLGIRSHGKGTFHSEVLPGMELETAQMHRVAANNFIVNITFGWEHAVAITNENDEGKLVSHRFPQYSFNEGIIPKFFKYLILDEKFRQHLELASPGGAGRNRVLKLDDMLEYQFMLPSVPEQESIADYLIKLDDLIQLKQSELEKLKNIKSALLEKMFV